jgi:hypothetical protein
LPEPFAEKQTSACPRFTLSQIIPATTMKWQLPILV